MPCNSDHMEPNVKERQINEAAQLLSYAYRALGRVVPKRVVDAANSPYGAGGGEEMMVELCDLIRNMNEVQQAQIVFNGRVREARRLADWWEEHQEEDRKRFEAERAELIKAKGAHAFFMNMAQSKNQAFLSIYKMVNDYAKATGLKAHTHHGEDVHVFYLSDGILIASEGAGFEVYEGKRVQ